jgi:hypothetical protein
MLEVCSIERGWIDKVFIIGNDECFRGKFSTEGRILNFLGV